jgi:hypothetical protein
VYHGRVADSNAGMDDVDYEDLETLWRDLEPSLAGLRSLEEVARLFTNALYERFASSVVLARVFATVDLQQLPADDRAFVERFAASTGDREKLTESPRPRSSNVTASERSSASVARTSDATCSSRRSCSAATRSRVPRRCASSR